jgi:DNA repair exonuclease SbcCD ATPase subunit
MEAQASRDDFNSRIRSVQAELEGMDAGSLEEELQKALNDLAAMKANVQRLAALAADLAAPEDKGASIALAKALERALGECESLETAANAARESCAKALDSAEQALQEKRTETQQQKLTLHGMGAQLDLLIATHGDDAARGQALVECRSEGAATQSLLKATTDAISALQPELLQGDRARLVRALKAGVDAQSDARSRIAVAKAALHSDGSEDPAAALAVAHARARSAGEQWKLVRRRSEGIALLDRMFREEQASLARRFTQPLAEKISGYLQCLFGAGTMAQVELEEDGFTGLRLFRPGFGAAPYDFSTLSGGAKEQAAAAVRLAMAEVLAVDHGGCLPVVFDDAFAYSDPDRVTHLQRMLDLAATRGLQVIVLTCNPADYASLGANTATLRPERLVESGRGGSVVLPDANGGG